ncbi:MAG TPA: type II toxin-antitoxin system death-on-curing family toxin [Arenimonas sp.]|nr:type II toxin-antitoxin system death-on-curing family toxin [Arenimonas sp.]
MAQFRWIDKQVLIMLHDESLALHGGASGIRDQSLLDSALHRAPNLATYGNPDYADLAAAYGIGLVNNHAIVDGNKRMAFLSVGLFLMLNGYKLTATQVDATLIMLAVAASDVAEAEFAEWLRRNTAQR